MKKLLILCGAILLLQGTINACEDKNALVNKRDYSVEETPVCKIERYIDEQDNLIIRYTYLQPDAPLRSSVETYYKNGSSVETAITKDGKLLRR